MFFSCQIHGQVKHEFKMPIFNMFILDYQPSYEIISKNELVGLEIGGGFDFMKTSAGLIDSTGNFNIWMVPDEYKSRVFKTSLALKFYFSRTTKLLRLGVIAGPFVELDKAVFYEQAFIDRSESNAILNPNLGRKFIGQRTIRPGLKGGLKLVYKTKLVLDLSMRFGWLFEEATMGNLKYRPKTNFLWPAVKFGYRFGEKYEPKVVE